MEIVALIIGLISLIGIVPVIYGWYIYLGKLIPARKFIGFDDKTILDVIVTTSSITTSSKGAKVTRSTTGIGQIQGATHVARFLGKCFRKKEINVHMSKTVNSRPVHDLVLLGGPAKNEYSSRFIDKISKEIPDLDLVVDDENCKISINNQSYNFGHLDIHSGYPKKDIGLVISWKNPFSSETKRAVYCAGLTSYGTSGCAMWLFEDILTNLGQKASSLFKAVGKKKPSFIAVLDIDIVNGGVASITELEIIPFQG